MTGARSLCPVAGCLAAIGQGEHMCLLHWRELHGLLSEAKSGYSTDAPVRMTATCVAPLAVHGLMGAIWLAFDRCRRRDRDARAKLQDVIAALGTAGRLADAVGESWLLWLRLQNNRLLVLSRAQEIAEQHIGQIAGRPA